MDETGVAVERSIDQLKKCRGFVRERYGLGFANQIDALVYGGGGKASIRFDLLGLVGRGTPENSADEVAQEAARIFANITDLNKKIETLHDQLLKLEK